MRTSWKGCLAALCSGALLLGTAHAGELAGQRVDAETADKTARKLLDTKVDLSRVRVVRMTVDGESLEVVSLQPARHHMAEKSPEAAGTIVAFTSDKESLIFLTRSQAGGPARRHSLAWDEIDSDTRFSFPVRTEAGKVEPAEIAVQAKFQRPKGDE